MDLTPSQRALLRSFVLGRTEDRDVANFRDKLQAARNAFDADLAGVDVSRALRAAGFNRAYEVNGRKVKDIIYRRAAR